MFCAAWRSKYYVPLWLLKLPVIRMLFSFHLEAVRQTDLSMYHYHRCTVLSTICTLSGFRYGRCGIACNMFQSHQATFLDPGTPSTEDHLPLVRVLHI
uniref:Putative secreted protein n=1 Tax=Ixodes ricinus TaxID=34613 RepID=A0A6B0UDX8_IXORI